MMARASIGFACCYLACTACSAADGSPAGGIGQMGTPSNGGSVGSGTGGVVGAGSTGSAGTPTGQGGAIASAGGASGGAGGSTSGAGGMQNGAGGAAGAPAAPPDISYTFPSITLDPGQEITGLCQSYTLNNASPIFVNKIVSSNQGKFHHSNWIWVADTSYPGADGTWTCTDRGFDQVLASAFGGVFFAQSTEATADTQGFPAGAAFQVPAHSRIIGDVHLLNPSSTPFTTSIHFDVYELPAASVKVQLQPMAFTNLALNIAPLAETQATMHCGTLQTDFDVYYILPHFHVLGQWLSIDVTGGAMDGTNIFRSQGSFGDSMNKTYDPPLSVHGASGLAITCDYQNPRATTVGYGTGDQEMCVALLYTSGNKVGAELVGNATTTDSGGIHSTDGTCIGL